MTDKETESYNFFKKCNEKDLENFDYFSEPSKLQIKYMETVLNLIQTQQEEIEKYKKAIDNACKILEDNEKKDKIIDEVISWIKILHDSLIEEYGTYETEFSINGDDVEENKIKEYFINKVDKENK